MKKAKQDIREKALEMGFDAVGFCAASGMPADGANLESYLERGNHGSMSWMAENTDRRSSPTGLWAEAKSVIVLGVNYGPDSDPLEHHECPERGVVSVYARGGDYHNLVKKRLKKLGRWMVETYGGDVKVFTDTAPVMEKPLAARAGLGWQGKHSILVSKDFGVWMFLGEVFTTLELEPDAPEPDQCGDCVACIEACPTGALYEPYRIDARRCISYLTIEHQEMIEPELMEKMGNRVFGCDDCLNACPWNKFAKPTKEEKFQPRPGTEGPSLARMAALDDELFRELYSGSIRRTGRDRMVRNALVAIGNSADKDFAAVAGDLLEDESQIVRETAKWALKRLNSQS